MLADDPLAFAFSTVSIFPVMLTFLFGKIAKSAAIAVTTLTVTVT
jgi:hypothetical protein